MATGTDVRTKQGKSVRYWDQGTTQQGIGQAAPGCLCGAGSCRREEEDLGTNVLHQC